MDEKQARTLASQLLESAEAAYLTTVDSDGFPQTRAMLNLRNKTQFPGIAPAYKNHDEDLLAYLTTANQSAKMAQLKANPKVAVYYCSAQNVHGLMLGGKIEVVTDAELKRAIWQDGWEMYYPGGVEGPEYGILRLLPVIAKGWYKDGPFHIDLGKE